MCGPFGKGVSVLFDTDVVIWALRGGARAAAEIDAADGRSVSVVTYMELLQGARDAREQRSIKSFLADLGFDTRPLTENVGHRASIYLEEYGLSTGLAMADALIAATAVEASHTLVTANRKHFRAIQELPLHVFEP